jgi:hypothetical protein
MATEAVHVLETLLAVWFCASGALAAGVVLAGVIRRRMLLRSARGCDSSVALGPVSVIVPIKGLGHSSEAALRSLLDQEYPCLFEVIIVVEDAADAADALVNKLCGAYPHARKVIAGHTRSCAQKNHNLIAGVAAGSPHSEVFVFCDSSNIAGKGWLEGLVRPLFEGQAEASTTFRVFDPYPPNAPGIAQAVYSSFVGLLIALSPMPWGGGAAILRATFLRLRVTEMWARTVVDDLTLGNILRAAKVAVLYLPHLAMRSPVSGQTVRGLLDYLDRQILFPKFTNPGIWVFGLFFQMNVTGAVLAALATVCLSSFSGIGRQALPEAIGFLGVTLALAETLRRGGHSAIPFSRWVAGYGLAIFAAGFIFLRSLFLDCIEWSGIRYVTTAGGVVTEARRTGEAASKGDDQE